MHELGMCEGLLAAVERRARGRAVARVGVRVGALLRVVPEAFQQSFALVATGGVAEGATVELTVVPVRSRCRACGVVSTAEDALPACPACGALPVEREGGDELVLEWLEYHDEAGAGRAPAAGQRTGS